jgi:hypothetical protein
MKLLWYSDFLHFKRKRKPISGAPYWHLPYGPVPKKHDFILGSMEGMDMISIREDETPEGYTMIEIKAVEKYDPNLFNEQEWGTIQYIEEYFKRFGSKAITDFAHKEAAWKETADEELISYQYADSLQLE